MTDTTLRDRIADAIRIHAITTNYWSINDLADAIITSLGLRTEHDYGTTYPKTPVTDIHYTRYTTDWKADD